MKTLRLFNGVIARTTATETVYVHEKGFVIEPGAMWAKDEIVRFYEEASLNGEELNGSFHKSWERVLTSTRHELAMEQVRHYFSTYGSDFKDEMYLPDEVLNLPEVKVKFRAVRAYQKDELKAMCLHMLNSGVALKAETISDLLTVLVEELGHDFTDGLQVRNKEAVILLADMYNVLPVETTDFMRFVVYKATGGTLLIKSKEVLSGIKDSVYNPAVMFERFGLEKLAEVFNRYKPIFLAFKNRCPKTINKIGRMSKMHHKPMPGNPLNMATSVVITDKDKKWLDKATPFGVYRALNACFVRLTGQRNFIFKIRNGKTYSIESEINETAVRANYFYLSKYWTERFDLKGKRFFMPEGVSYAMPVSEKKFVGNVPMGTRFFGEKLAAGVYWKNEWGVRDLDLSGLNVSGKVGWNAAYKQKAGVLMYSGDVTNAPVGAVEYLYAADGLKEPTLVKCNAHTGGEDGYEYKLIVGLGDDVMKAYMVDPAGVFMQEQCKAVSKEMIVGLFLPQEGKKVCFVVMNYGAGKGKVSGDSVVSILSRRALTEEYGRSVQLKGMILASGGVMVDTAEDADVDLSIDNLKKDTILNIFK